MTPKGQLLIHASNVTGLGARHVVQSLLDALARTMDLGQTAVYAASTGGLDCGRVEESGARVVLQRRLMPNAVSRAWECLVAHEAFQGFQRSLIMGDVPLCGVHRQVVFVHQPHLLSPQANGFCSPSLKFRVMRWIFRRNLAFVQTVVVQTGAMRDYMIDSYPELQKRVVVIPQPAPSWFQARSRIPRRPGTEKLRMFYPAAGYPHKNHALLKRMDTTHEASSGVELVVTLNEVERDTLRLPHSWVRNVGRLAPDACVDAYRETDALFFPSLLESYGLPLVEAMTLGLPVLCADLPYAHWLCETEAIYFDPSSAESAWSAVCELRRRLDDGWQPDWRRTLAKLPKDWDEVALRFLETLELEHG